MDTLDSRRSSMTAATQRKRFPFRSRGSLGARPAFERPTVSKFLPFDRRLSESVQKGETTGTFRLLDKPFYPSRGETFKARTNGVDLDGDYVCVEKRRMNFAEMVRKNWDTVVQTSPEDYQSLMSSILGGRAPKPESVGYFFRFRRCDSPAPTE